MEDSWVYDELQSMDLRDKRLEKRLISLLETLSRSSTARIPTACSGRAEMVAAYRFFENEKGGFANVLAPQIDASYQRTARQRPTSKVSRLLARTKQPTSKEIKELLVEAGSSLVEQLTVRERAGKY